MAIGMEKDVPVVTVRKIIQKVYQSPIPHEKQPNYSPILNLQQVGNQAVRRTGLHKVALGRPEALRVLTAPVLVGKVVAEALVGILLDLVQRDGVQDRFDQAGIVRQTDDLVRSHPEVYVFLLPNQLEHLSRERNRCD